ncbi:hypothetical protein [Nocardioides halotolerans]|uniref:hypothetical protein n=1 Tax=Nocardioides halotolerans TaxID=433660 RepID=UPI00041C96F1|nr:hypothetical protein [Nocardioides halotolerans]
MSATEVVADVAVIGGTGFYAFLEDASDGVEQHAVTTPYGDPSAPVASAPSPGGAWRSCRGTARTTTSRRT